MATAIAMVDRSSSGVDGSKSWGTLPIIRATMARRCSNRSTVEHDAAIFGLYELPVAW